MRYHVTREELERRDPARVFSAGGTLYAFNGGRYGLGTLSLFLSETPPGSGPRWHTHPYDEAIALHEGEGRYFVGDAVVKARAGDVVIIPAGVPHTFVNAGTGPLRHTAAFPSDTIVTVFVEGGREGSPHTSAFAEVGGTQAGKE